MRDSYCCGRDTRFPEQENVTVSIAPIFAKYRLLQSLQNPSVAQLDKLKLLQQNKHLFK
jgi:hypothetical protein